VYDPARGVAVTEVALASASEVGDVVKVAVAASRGWGDTPLSRRVPMLFRLRELLDGHRGRVFARR